MTNEPLLSQIAEWHTSRMHDKIREAILALPENERTDEFVCLLSRVLFNEGDYVGALKLLDNIRESYSDDPYCCYRRGFTLYCLHREHEALPWFKKAQELGLEDIDETPGEYYPKSVIKWIERSEKWAPRRIEKNTFEEERRANRNRIPLDTALSDADLAELWDDCDYSLQKYVGRIPTDADIAAVEAELGYRLPLSYQSLIKRHNGGILLRNCFENPLQRGWERDKISVESIYGIDPDKPYSLCGSRGNKFWVDEWGYPDIGIAICGTESGGHDMIFLDYSDCGKSGEPCVINIDQESDYEITYLADDFGSFVRGLVPYYENQLIL